MSPRERRGDRDSNAVIGEAEAEELSLPGDSTSEPSSNDRPARRAVDALVVEARTVFDVRGPDDVEGTKNVLGEMDWSRLESRLMASVELEKPALVRDVEGAKTRGARFLRAGAFALAVAAAVTIVVRRDRDVALDGAHSTTASTEAAPASALRTTEGSGEVRVGGVVATPGYVVRAGDTIEVSGDGSAKARGVFERARKVAWLMEVEPMRANEVTRARVKSAGEALVLGLENGVIEAQVVPVPSGEAFAVDIATEKSLVRVAVHGTHLRVARSGTRVVVDLTEGVIAIGVPPRAGVTVGTTVAAPAHVELDATDLTTLRIDHSPGSVRAAIPLGNGGDVPRPDTMAAETAQATVPAPMTVTKTNPAAREATASVKLDPPKVQLPAREAIAAGVRECAAAHGRSGEVHVTVNSSLRLKVSPTGAVESAVFSPPLSPDVQTCAAQQVIYKVKLEETGLVTIPIEFSY